jgi:O-antigen/teichoic acid export membrane protein
MNPVRSRLEAARRALRDDATLTAVVKHTGWLTGASGANIVLSALQGILTARLLGVAVWGMLGLAISFSTVLSLLLSFRMREFVVKWVSHFGDDRTGRAATAFKLALAGDFSTALMAFAIVQGLAGWGAYALAKNPDFVWAFRAMALVIVFQAGQESLTGILHVKRDFRVQSLIRVASQAASVCGIAVAYLSGWGIRGVVGILVAAAALTSLLMWTFGLRAARAVLGPGWVRRPLARLGEFRSDMMRFAVLGNLRGTLSSLLNDGDLLVLGYLRNPVEVGYYKLAVSICQIASLPNGPLTDASFPEFSAAVATRSWDRFRSLMRRGSEVAALWAVPVSLGLVALSHPAIAALYGRAFLPAASALAILLVGIIVDVVLFWGGAALLSMGEPGYIAGVALWAVAVKYALAFLLVPTGGYLALAAVQSVVVVGMNLLAARRARSRLRVRESMPA